MAKSKHGLGRGLDALFTDNGTSDVSISELPIDEIEPDANQPRKDFDEEALNQLADSIREHGVINPIIVRPLINGRYQIIAGERRWRSAKIVGLSTVPVSIRDFDDNESNVVALVDNLIREDLNPIEEALGYKKLVDDFGLTQEEISKQVAKSRPSIANSLRLLSLPNRVLDLIKNGTISAGHARAILSLKEEKQIIDLANEIEKNGLSVRDTENKVKKLLSVKDNPPSKNIRNPIIPTLYKETELALSEYLSRKVSITPLKNGKGTLSIEFYSEDELREIAKLFS